jgi:LysR family transcriptional regulator, transcription activator of glutamate synthase operon
VNIDFIEGFLESVHLKSIAKASEKLRISHPALSKQIRALEAYFDVTLLKRSSSGVELTDDGKIFYDRIVPVFSEVKAIKKEFQSAAAKHKITLGTLPSLAAHYLPEIVYRCEENQMEIKLVVRDTSEELEELLNRTEIDAAVLEIDPSHNSKWHKDLFIEPYIAIVYSNHRFATRSSIGLHELSSEPLILNPPSCSIRKRITSLLADLNMSPFIKAEVNFGEFIPGYVAAGAGISIVPKLAADRLGHNNLISIPIDDNRAKRLISLAAASNKTGKMLYPYFA